MQKKKFKLGDEMLTTYNTSNPCKISLHKLNYSPQSTTNTLYLKL